MCTPRILQPGLWGCSVQNTWTKRKEGLDLFDNIDKDSSNKILTYQVTPGKAESSKDRILWILVPFVVVLATCIMFAITDKNRQVNLYISCFPRLGHFSLRLKKRRIDIKGRLARPRFFLSLVL